MKFGKLSLDNENLRLLLIIVGIAVVFYLLQRHYSSHDDEGYIDTDRPEAFEPFEDVTTAPAEAIEPGAGEFNVQPVVNNVANNTKKANNNAYVQQQVNNNAYVQQQVNDVSPAEAWGMNEQPRGINYLNNDGVSPGQIPNECYPKDTLKSSDLLPGDANSVWAQVNPSGQGSLGDSNLLNSAYHIGINTVGQTLRNASHQLRSEPPNPQVKVSPWMQTTIEPDISRRPLEIGSDF